MSGRKLQKYQYNVGWICALPKELGAALMVLDARHEPPYDLETSDNSYEFGSIGDHNVAITTLDKYGNNSAASVATQFKNDFPDLDYRFMVGVGGGAPSSRHDVRLGDVVVGYPGRACPGVVQLDLHKTLPNGKFEKIGWLDQPPRNIMRVLPRIIEINETPGDLGFALLKIMEDRMNVNRRPRFKYPKDGEDYLFQADYIHNPSLGTESCRHCDPNYAIPRERREKIEERDSNWFPQMIDKTFEIPFIHFGPIGSSNTLMKDGITRDKAITDYKILCFEMEAAGILEAWPSLIVRGISDYSDSHKNKDWQGFAAGIAAAFTRFLLCKIHRGVSRRRQEPTLESYTGHAYGDGEWNVENAESRSGRSQYGRSRQPEYGENQQSARAPYQYDRRGGPQYPHRPPPRPNYARDGREVRLPPARMDIDYYGEDDDAEHERIDEYRSTIEQQPRTLTYPPKKNRVSNSRRSKRDRVSPSDDESEFYVEEINSSSSVVNFHGDVKNYGTGKIMTGAMNFNMPGGTFNM